MPADFTWDLTMMYLIHRALRRDLQAFAATLRDPSDPLKNPPARAAFEERWSFVHRTLHHHHSGEDEVLWPYMREARPESAELMDAMASEHSQLDPALTAIDEGVACLEGSTDDHRKALADRIDQLARILGHHLDHEEQDAVPLLSATIDAKTAKDFERQQQKSMGLSDAAVFFPWITAQATPAEGEVAWGNLPPPVRWLVRKRWVRNYTRTTALAFPVSS